MSSKTSKSIDLGAAQQRFEQSEREYRAAEKALAKANEDRDNKKRAFEQADQALQAAVRSVRG